MKQTITRAAGALALATALVLAGCGGGGSSSSTPSTTPPSTTPPPTQGGGISGTGTILKPSANAVVVNGVTFSATSATVRIDDGNGTRNGTLDDVKEGMTGKVRGRVNDDRVTGTADTIEIENEVRGLAQNVQPSVSPQRFTVNGQTVYVDSQTVYANLAGFGAIVGGTTYVEVHGLRDSTGAIRATRVEAQTQGAAGLVDEIRGTVTAVGASSFTLGTVTVTYTGATTFAPAGSNAGGLQVGTIVEVHGNFTAGTSTFAATKIDFEDSEDSSLAPSGTDSAEVEGYVSGFTGLAATFKVGTRTVSVSSSTRYEGGASVDLANDTRVEAEGNVNASGVLVANKIQFKQARIILQSVPTVVNATTLNVLGKTVQVTTLTRIDARSASGNSTSLTDIQANVDCVEVRASLVGTSIVADEVKEQSSGGCDWILRAPVEARDSTAGTVTMLGTLVNVNSALFRDTNDAVITRAAFFQGANVGTVVKTKGTNPNASPLVAAEAELEN
jgi:hypothetical protein